METGYNYRFTTIAVDAFESRTRLYMGEWQAAYDNAERVLAQQSTLEDYNTPDFLLPNQYKSVESINAYENAYITTRLRASLATPAFVQMFTPNDDLRPAHYLLPQQ